MLTRVLGRQKGVPVRRTRTYREILIGAHAEDAMES
jgi:hypothetical protein